MILVPTSIVMYMVVGLMVTGSGIQAVPAVFLLLLVFVAMFCGTCATAEGTAYTMGSHATTKDRSQACCHPPCSHQDDC
jgi:phosphate/sulfate permease